MSCFIIWWVFWSNICGLWSSEWRQDVWVLMALGFHNNVIYNPVASPSTPEGREKMVFTAYAGRAKWRAHNLCGFLWAWRLFMPQNMLQATGKVTAFRGNCINYHHAQKSLTGGEVSGIQFDECQLDVWPLCAARFLRGEHTAAHLSESLRCCGWVQVVQPCAPQTHTNTNTFG